MREERFCVYCGESFLSWPREEVCSQKVKKEKDI